MNPVNSPFEQRLSAVADEVEAWLAGYLAEHAGGARGEPTVPARLDAAMRHAALGGGKRLRPFLVIECAGLLGVAPAQAMPAAAALELVHCYSLVHDDLPAMDNDALRRGRPTVWKAYDEWTAVLAGDALLTEAFILLADARTHADAGVRVALVSALARASGRAGMVGGQCLDLEADKLGRQARPTVDAILALQAMKTGALLVFAAEAGAILAEAAPQQRAALAAYGAHLGTAFQIADDLLDAEGEAAVVGKAVAKDAAAGKATLVGLLGTAEARRRLATAEAAAIAALGHFGPAADTLRDAARFVSQRRK